MALSLCLLTPAVSSICWLRWNRLDNVKTWTGLPVEDSIRMTDDRDKWRKSFQPLDQGRRKNNRERKRQTVLCAFVYFCSLLSTGVRFPGRSRGRSGTVATILRGSTQVVLQLTTARWAENGVTDVLWLQFTISWLCSLNLNFAALSVIVKFNS